MARGDVSGRLADLTEDGLPERDPPDLRGRATRHLQESLGRVAEARVNEGRAQLRNRHDDRVRVEPARPEVVGITQRDCDLGAETGRVDVKALERGCRDTELRQRLPITRRDELVVDAEQIAEQPLGNLALARLAPLGVLEANLSFRFR